MQYLILCAFSLTEFKKISNFGGRDFINGPNDMEDFKKKMNARHEWCGR